MKEWFKQLFIPSAENSYAPQSLQKAAVVGILAMVLLSFTLTNVQSLLWVASDWMVSTILPAVIVTDTNKERAEESLQPLARNTVLDRAAQLKAEDMAKNSYFAHYSPTGISPWYWFSQVGYSYVHAGENLAVHFTDSGEVVEAWMNSPTHRANIMNGDYVEIGIGTAEGTYEGFKTVFVVQLFGTPAAVAPTPAVASGSVSVPPVPAIETAVTEETEASSDTEPVVLARESEITETVEVVSVPEEVSVSVPEEVPTVAYTEDDTVVLSLEPISTSTGAVPATITGTPTSQADTTVSFFRLFTEPQRVLIFLYSLLAAFVTVALVLSIGIEIRHQQPVQIAYGFLLLGMMSGLLYMQLWMTSGAIIT